MLMDLSRIITPRKFLTTFSVGQVNNQALQHSIQNHFDHAPVVDEMGHPLGIVSIDRIKEISAHAGKITTEHIDSHMLDLADRITIPDFLTKLGATSAMLILDSSRQEASTWYGLTTISDLNKHPFRAQIYPVLASLESSFAELVERHFQTPKEWIEKCSQNQQVQHWGQWHIANLKGVETSPIVSCTLTDLITIVAKTDELRSMLGYRSRTAFERAYNPLVDLRNSIMHPVRPLVLGNEDVSKLAQSMESAIDLDLQVNRLLVDVTRSNNPEPHPA